MPRGSLLLATALLLSACTTASPSPSPTVQPTPSPSPTPAGRTFTQADFTKSGGCGDVFVWATSPDDVIGVTMQWNQAAAKAWERPGFDDSVTLPVAEVQVFLVHGSQLSQTYCTDIGGMGSVEGQAPAAAGTVEIVVTPDAGGFQPASHANVTLKNVVFDIVQGTATEQWRIDLLDLEDLSVGWFAG